MSAPPKSSRKRLKKLLVCIALAPSILCPLFGVIGGLASRFYLNHLVSEARAAGQPFTLEEIAASRRVWPADQDGAQVLLNLRSRLEALDKDHELKELPIVGCGDLPALGCIWSPEEQGRVSTQLARLSVELSAIDRLKDYPGGSIPSLVSYLPDEPLARLLPELIFVRVSLKLKALQTLASAMDGRTAGIVDDVGVLTRHGELLDDYPTLVGSLVRIALDRYTITVTGCVLSLSNLSPAQLALLDRALPDPRLEGLYWGYIGERGYVCDGMDRLAAGTNWYARLHPAWALIRFDEAADLREYARILSALDDPVHLLEVIGQVEAKVDANKHWYHLVPFEPCRRACELYISGMASCRAARVGIAAERYRLDTGAFPQRFEQLVPDYIPEVPLDPFDDAPLRYVVTDKGVTVYSVGPNRTDDGGAVASEACGPESPDVGFIVLKPEFRRIPSMTTQHSEHLETSSVQK